MAEIILSKGQQLTFIIPKEEGEGVRRVAKKVVEDVEKTTGLHPSMALDGKNLNQAVIAVTAGNGKTAKLLEQRIPELEKVKGKWEVYGFYLMEHPYPGVEQGLLIYGSDKLGTIYGLFHLSELLGITACTFWGDTGHPVYEKLVLKTRENTEKSQIDNCIFVENGISREPSVKYRGFFINDEWPCFGNWTCSHFKGFTAQMYDHVFEYLLRMKGNYLWPAMWTSSFLLDGPGMESMKLADAYGIYIGMSHHEPCMRSSEEWDLVKGKDSPYGEDWSYLTNKEGLLKYWEDGLKRCCGHQVFPTIGMRGERDSKMLGEDAQIEENVRVLKDIITQQRRLIRENLEQEGQTYPLLFAVYKEVEDYYFGDSKTAGLRDFQELDGVTLMLCEDNFGNMRALPRKEERCRNGGFGMYFHLDYHGGPCSYEWVASTPVTKIWEQMSMAYEYGIQDVWIVNAGDVKFQEYPLNFFMDMAYDFETWGKKEAAYHYVRKWTREQFGTYTTKEEQDKIAWILEEYIRLNHLRRPESCNDKVYHPAHFEEGRKMLLRCKKLEQENEAMLALLKERGREEAYFSMIYYAAAASANLLKMHLYAGMNHHFAIQGKAVANEMGDKMEECIARDEQLSEKMRRFKDGKWAGMESACHIGFTNWNSEDWRYPLKYVVRLPKQPRLVVSRADEEAYYTNQYFPIPILVDDFSTSQRKKITLEIANGGQGVVKWSVDESCPWLSFSAMQGETKFQDRLTLTVHRELLPLEEEQEFCFYIRAGEESVPVQVRAKRRDFSMIPSGCFLPQKGRYVIPAVEYIEKTEGFYEGKKAAYERLEDYGKYETGMKVFPVTSAFVKEDTGENQAPSLTYSLWVEEEGRYELQLHTSPANPLVYGEMLTVGLSCNQEAVTELIITDESYKGGDNACATWEHAMLIQEHISTKKITLKKGENRITLYPREAGLVLERLVLHPAGEPIEVSYLGPDIGFKKE
ncbi:MAG: glycosyl hydrolase 115 family protein [Blautia sp.]|uniref:glycosyl hydrolase 115 family protein n=1 Tax=Blautia sp. TaxID=1955243 RepID=UPI002E78E069|nr:glycosyl hydrolase 115 family protein [Blautia sp.]MEE1443802.1 glycosyl hydrolase 115 family protein [Blautia sp.]